MRRALRRPSAGRSRGGHASRASSWRRGSSSIRAKPIVALLPGSRPNELHRLVPVLAAAVPRIASAVVGTQFLVARAPHLPDSYFAPFHGVGAPVRVVEGADRRRARRERRRDHRVGHGDRSDGAARQADGRGVSAVAGDLQARQAAGARVDVQHGESRRRRARRRGADSGRSARRKRSRAKPSTC